MPAEEERDESKGGLRETMGGKLKMLVLDNGTGKRKEEQMKVFLHAVVDFQEEMWGCLAWWGRGQLLKKSQAAHVTLCGRPDMGVRWVCNHHHLGP